MVARGRETRKLVVTVSRDERNELKGEKTHDLGTCAVHSSRKVQVDLN
jgi:hypothetical protein